MRKNGIGTRADNPSAAVPPQGYHQYRFLLLPQCGIAGSFPVPDCRVTDCQKAGSSRRCNIRTRPVSCLTDNHQHRFRAFKSHQIQSPFLSYCDRQCSFRASSFAKLRCICHQTGGSRGFRERDNVTDVSVPVSSITRRSRPKYTCMRWCRIVTHRAGSRICGAVLPGDPEDAEYRPCCISLRWIDRAAAHFINC